MDDEDCSSVSSWYVLVTSIRVFGASASHNEECADK